jgi:hypothetical protein
MSPYVLQKYLVLANSLTYWRRYVSDRLICIYLVLIESEFIATKFCELTSINWYCNFCFKVAGLR